MEDLHTHLCPHCNCRGVPHITGDYFIRLARFSVKYGKVKKPYQYQMRAQLNYDIKRKQKGLPLSGLPALLEPLFTDIKGYPVASDWLKVKYTLE